MNACGRGAVGALIFFVAGSVSATAQEFDAVFKQALSDAANIYSDSATMARVSGLVSLDFQLKTVALTGKAGQLSAASEMRTAITASEPYRKLWSEVFAIVFEKRIFEGQDIDWDSAANPIIDELRTSYNERFELHSQFVSQSLQSRYFDNAASESLISQIDAALLTTLIIYREFRQKELSENESMFVAFIDCIFYPFCY